MPHSVTRTLKFKVRSESYDWLCAAAIEVNQVFNYCNETAYLAATRTDLKRNWVSGFDLCNLTSGATSYFEYIGADTIQRVCTEYAPKDSPQAPRCVPQVQSEDDCSVPEYLRGRCE
jgi:putative transposase